MEFILEFILESLFHIPIENQKARTWFRSILFSVLWLAVDALCIFGTVVVWQRGDDPLMMGVTAVLAIAMTLGGIYMVVDGHKRNWEQ